MIFPLSRVSNGLLAPRGHKSAALGVTVILEQIIWHEEGAVPLAFYMAAREATQKLVDGNIGEQVVSEV